MKLNIFTVIEWLEKRGKKCYLSTIHSDITASSVKWLSNDGVEKETLYVVEDMSRENHIVVVIDKGSLCVCESSAEVLFDDFLMMFRYYQGLESRALNALFYKRSLEELASVASALFDSPVLIEGENRTLLAGSRQEWETMKSLEKVERIISFDFSSKTADTDPLPEYRKTIHPVQLRSSIWIGNTKVGRIIVSCYRGSIHAGTISFLRWITKLTERLISLEPQRYCLPSTLEQKLHMLLIGRQTDTGDLEHSLASLNWHSGDCYIFAVLAGFASTEYMDVLLTAIRQKCQAFRFLYHEDSLILLGNLRYEPDFQSIVQRIVVESGLQIHMGTSYPFYGWNNLLRFYQQSREIADFAIQENKTVLDVQSQMVQVLENIAAADEQLSCLVHPDLQKLRQYDEANGTQMLYTLQVYLFSGCRIPLASTVLNIHANTLRYRLHRIEEILPCNLFDVEYRQQITYAMLLPSSAE